MANNLFKTSAVDFFGNSVVSQRTNQIEVPLDDVNWASFVTTASQHGSAARADGQVTFSTSTNANGYYGAISLDVVKYRSGAEIGWGFTWKFPTTGVANSYQRIGATDNLSWSNAVYFGYEGTSFGIYYRRNSTQIFGLAQESWDDPCDGSAGSRYTLNGSPVALDITKNQLSRIRAGLFGYAGFIVEILTPDSEWITIVSYSGINSDTVSIFSDFDLRIAAEVRKTAADATNLQLVSACWAGWTGISLQRIENPITDRTLAQVTRAVIEGKSSSGSGTYVPVKVNPSGALETNAAVTGEVSILDDVFTRLLEKRFLNTEEVRYDIPATLADSSIYMGIATDGSLTSASVWNVVRFYFDVNANPSRARIQLNIAWDNRTAGWT